MTSKLNLEDHLSLRDKYFVSRSFLLYWWIKKKAITIGRIKSCRAMKVMKPKTKEEIDVWKIVETVGSSTSKEHAKNLKFLLECNDYIQGSEAFGDISLESRRGRIKIACLPKQAKLNVCLRLIIKNSNIPNETFKDQFLDESSISFFCFYYTGHRSVASSARSIREDYEKIGAFVKKLRNTITLINKVCPHIPSIDTYEWWTPNRDELTIDFTGVTDSDLSPEAILKSELVIKAKHHPPIIVVGDSIPATQRVRQITAQDRLNDYVQNTIIARRNNAN